MGHRKRFGNVLNLHFLFFSCSFKLQFQFSEVIKLNTEAWGILLGHATGFAATHACSALQQAVPRHFIFVALTPLLFLGTLGCWKDDIRGSNLGASTIEKHATLSRIIDIHWCCLLLMNDQTWCCFVNYQRCICGSFLGKPENLRDSLGVTTCPVWVGVLYQYDDRK